MIDNLMKKMKCHELVNRDQAIDISSINRKNENHD